MVEVLGVNFDLNLKLIRSQGHKIQILFNAMTLTVPPHTQPIIVGKFELNLTIYEQGWGNRNR